MSSCSCTGMDSFTFPWLYRKPLLVWLYVLVVVSSEFFVPVYTYSWKDKWTANDKLDLPDAGRVLKFKDRWEGEGQDEADENIHYKVLMLDGEYMVVGAKDAVHNISMRTLREDKKRRLTWKSTETDVSVCKAKYPDKASKCQNYIQVFGKNSDGTFYVCGTNAFQPWCKIYRFLDNVLPNPVYIPDHEEQGIGKCPFDPDHNSTAIFVDGNLYAATVAATNDPIILREINEGKDPVRTVQYDSKHINDPDFVNSFEYDEKVYFFFREVAVETSNCVKSTYSRIARVCKTDTGGLIGETWTSYFKARLNCSIPGDINFYFDEIASTTDLGEGNYQPTEMSKNRTRMFYGVFNTPENSIWGSAVCAFTYNDVLASFAGKFISQEAQDQTWVPVDPQSPHPTLCVNDSKSIPKSRQAFIRKHPIMERAVPAAGGSPVLVNADSKSRFTAIAVDWQWQAADNSYYDIMFVGTDDGRILKSINRGRGSKIEGTVIEDIQVLETDEAVRELKIYKETQMLVVISHRNIVSIPLHRCGKHTTCGDCIALQDPYCSWSEGQCDFSTRGLQSIHNGDVRVCPDGGIRDSHKPSSIPTTTTTEKPGKAQCPECKCDCENQPKSKAFVDVTQPTDDGETEDVPETGIEHRTVDDKSPCAPRIDASRSSDQVYTASTLAIASVISIVVSIIVGFLIGYRVSMCRSHTRNTDQMISEEQTFGSLRKTRNSSSSSSHNYYSEPAKIKNLLANNITSKSPNLPNGSIESKAVSGKPVSKTYL